MLDRRSFCTLIVGAVAPKTCDGYEDRDFVVHQMLPRRSQAYRIGEVIHDPRCGRYFRLAKMIETSNGPLAKLRCVSRAT